MAAARPPADGWRFWRQQVAAAAILIQPFAALTALLLFIAPPDPAAFAVADPIVRSLGLTLGLFAIPAAALLSLPVWLLLARPSAVALMRSLQLAAAGVAIAIAAALLIRALAGEHLPGFIPPEESAAPGLSAGLAAGLIEEVLIRLAVLPAALALARRVLAPPAAAAVAVLVAAATFALLHQVGPGARPFVPAYAATRFLFPGLLMSVAALWPGPALVCVGHCAAHLLIPLFFA
jgi:CAAX prenyl protease-like protein